MAKNAWTRKAQKDRFRRKFKNRRVYNEKKREAGENASNRNRLANSSGSY